MESQDFTALLVSCAYLLGLVLAAVAAHRYLGVKSLFTRKLVIVGTGMWSIAAVRLFSSWEWAIVPPLTLALLFYLSYRYDLVEAIEDSERVNMGLVFFPVAIALLLGLFWRPGSPQDAGYVGVAALMAATWGDTAAALIGRRYGTRRYRMLGHRRTMEGTLALFFVSGVAMAPVLAVMGAIDWHQSVAFALIAATVVSLIEIVSFYGSDNLTIPLAAALTLSLLTRLS